MYHHYWFQREVVICGYEADAFMRQRCHLYPQGNVISRSFHISTVAKDHFLVGLCIL